MGAKIKKLSKNLIFSLIGPIVVYAVFSILSRANGIDTFGVGADLEVIFRNTIYSGLISLAVSYNLTSGRFDFSVGATLILSVILSVDIAQRLGLGPVQMLLICMIIGAILGTISGLTYVWLRLPPMVVSLGITMIYEAIAFMYKSQGVKLIGQTKMLIFARQPYITILAIIIVGALVLILNFTKFGYDTNSLRGGQQIAVNVGINEKKNTVVCYLVAGSLMAAAGIINLSILGTCAPKTGMASSSYIMNAFLPLFIGGALAKYSDRNIGIILGSFMQACMISVLGKFNISPSVQTIISGMVVFIFLIYTSNSYKFAEAKMFKNKLARARAMQAEA
jgi:ribose transport system permease protein